MRRLVFTCLVCLSMGFVGHAQSWITLQGKVAGSVFRLVSKDKDGTGGICAAVLINKDRAALLTAAHCVSPIAEGRSIVVDDRYTTVERWNEILDLAIVRTPGIKGTPLPLRAEPITVGTPIAFVGYAFGAARQKYTFGFVSDVEDASIEIGSTFFNTEAINGQSGGLIVDEAGALVSIVQGAFVARSGSLSVGPTPARLKAFAEDYWPQP